MKLYVVFKRKGAKQWVGALPARPSATKAKLQSMLKDQLRSGFTARIVSEAMLKRIMQRQGVNSSRIGKATPKKRKTHRKHSIKRRTSKRRTVKRRIRRKR